MGKSTTAVNLSSCVAAEGKKVLVVDLDPQGNSTSGYGISKRSVNKSVYELLIGEAKAEEAILPTQFQVDIIPSNIQLSGAVVELVSLPRRESRLREALAGVPGNTITYSSTARPAWICSPSTACAPAIRCSSPSSANITRWKAYRNDGVPSKQCAKCITAIWKSRVWCHHVCGPAQSDPAGGGPGEKSFLATRSTKPPCPVTCACPKRPATACPSTITTR